MSRLRHWHQHRHGPLGQRGGGNAQGTRESASGDHDQVLSMRRRTQWRRSGPLSERERILSGGSNARASHAQVDIRALTHDLARYRRPNHGRSIVEILITVAPFVVLWLAAYLSLRIGYGVYLLFAIPAAGFLVRLFMIQHDCGHGSFFRHRLVNDWVGRVIGVLTLTPYDFWRRAHGVHHATSGNLDRRGIGDIDTLTIREYLALSRMRRFGYRLYRHPIIMFGIGPIYLFVLRHRLPFGLMRQGWAPWVSTMATNGGIAIIVAAVMWRIGIVPFLLVH